MFISEFTAAYTKMLTKGYDVCDLEVVPSAGEELQWRTRTASRP